MEEVIGFIVIGFICIACPIMIFIVIWSLPWYLIVSYFVWILLSLSTIMYSKEEKWLNMVLLLFFFTFIFTLIMATCISNSDNYIFDHNNAAFIMAPALNIPALYFIGNLMKEKGQENQEIKRQGYNMNIDKQISNEDSEIRKLEQSIKSKIVITHFVEMLDCCGEDVSQIASDPRVSNISRIASEIKKGQEKIRNLQEKKR